MQQRIEFRVHPSIDDAKVWFLVLIQPNNGKSERVNIPLTSKTRKNFVALRSILDHKDPCEITVLKQRDSAIVYSVDLEKNLLLIRKTEPESTINISLTKDQALNVLDFTFQHYYRMRHSEKFIEEMSHFAYKSSFIHFPEAL